MADGSNALKVEHTVGEGSMRSAKRTFLLGSERGRDGK